LVDEKLIIGKRGAVEKEKNLGSLTKKPCSRMDDEDPDLTVLRPRSPAVMAACIQSGRREPPS
jgi:hypothetical protein